MVYHQPLVIAHMELITLSNMLLVRKKWRSWDSPAVKSAGGLSITPVFDQTPRMRLLLPVDSSSEQVRRPGIITFCGCTSVTIAADYRAGQASH